MFSCTLPEVAVRCGVKLPGPLPAILPLPLLTMAGLGGPVVLLMRGMVIALEGGVATEKEDGCRRTCSSSPVVMSTGAEVVEVEREGVPVVTGGGCDKEVVVVTG